MAIANKCDRCGKFYEDSGKKQCEIVIFAKELSKLSNINEKTKNSVNDVQNQTNLTNNNDNSIYL